MKKFNIQCEEWREYEFNKRIYRINKPKFLFLRENGTHHRVVDSKGIAHCIPAPGTGDCVLRWKNKDSRKPVNF